MQISHFDCEEVRQLILPTQFESMFTRILTQTMGSKDCGPEIRVSRYGRLIPEYIILYCAVYKYWLSIIFKMFIYNFVLYLIPS